jgi:hypothetical protein
MISQDVLDRCILAWQEAMPYLDFKKQQIEYIKANMIEIAYHEAGHAAARAFIGDDITHFKMISIIPQGVLLGVFRLSEVYVMPLSDYPPLLAWRKAQHRMIFLLAGKAAERRVNTDAESIEDEILESSWQPDYITEEEWRAGADAGQVLEIAEAVAKKGWSPMRIINMVERWTTELMENPVVWGVVESMAQRLLSKGEVTDFDEFYEIVRPAVNKLYYFPDWRRRMKIDREEIDRQWKVMIQSEQDKRVG